MEEIKVLAIGYREEIKAFNRAYFEDHHKFESLDKLGFGTIKKRMKLGNGKEVELKLSEVLGAERYRKLDHSFYAKSNGILMIYDINKRSSFENILLWIKGIREDKNNIPILIIGIITDIEKERFIKEEEGKNLDEKNNCIFYESNYVLRININEPINTLVEQIVKQREEGKHK